MLLHSVCALAFGIVAESCSDMNNKKNMSLLMYVSRCLWQSLRLPSQKTDLALKSLWPGHCLKDPEGTSG